MGTTPVLLVLLTEVVDLSILVGTACVNAIDFGMLLPCFLFTATDFLFDLLLLRCLVLLLPLLTRGVSLLDERGGVALTLLGDSGVPVPKDSTV